MPTVTPNPVACPHYGPDAVGMPTYVCRGCGSTIADPRHLQNQAQGISAHTMVGRPETRNLPKSKERIA